MYETPIEFPDVKGISLEAYMKLVLDWAERKGWNKDLDIPKQLMNLHSEISEAWEEYRKGNPIKAVYYSDPGGPVLKPEGLGIELIDLFIRLLHIFAYYDINVPMFFTWKMQYNEYREYRHGGKLA